MSYLLYFTIPFNSIIANKNRVPGYDIWAQSARAWCTQKEADRIFDQVPVLNDACREAFSSILDKLDSQRRQIASVTTQVTGFAAQLSTVLDSLQAGGRQYPLQHGEDGLPHQAGEDGDNRREGKLWLVVVWDVFFSPVTHTM